MTDVMPIPSSSTTEVTNVSNSHEEEFGSAQDFLCDLQQVEQEAVENEPDVAAMQAEAVENDGAEADADEEAEEDDEVEDDFDEGEEGDLVQDDEVSFNLPAVNIIPKLNMAMLTEGGDSAATNNSTTVNPLVNSAKRKAKGGAKRVAKAAKTTTTTSKKVTTTSSAALPSGSNANAARTLRSQSVYHGSSTARLGKSQSVANLPAGPSLSLKPMGYGSAGTTSQKTFTEVPLSARGARPSTGANKENALESGSLTARRTSLIVTSRFMVVNNSNRNTKNSCVIEKPSVAALAAAQNANAVGKATAIARRSSMTDAATAAVNKGSFGGAKRRSAAMQLDAAQNAAAVATTSTEKDTATDDESSHKKMKVNNGGMTARSGFFSPVAECATPAVSDFEASPSPASVASGLQFTTGVTEEIAKRLSFGGKPSPAPISSPSSHGDNSSAAKVSELKNLVVDLSSSKLMLENELKTLRNMLSEHQAGESQAIATAVSVSEEKHAAELSKVQTELRATRDELRQTRREALEAMESLNKVEKELKPLREHNMELESKLSKLQQAFNNLTNKNCVLEERNASLIKQIKSTGPAASNGKDGWTDGGSMDFAGGMQGMADGRRSSIFALANLKR